MSNDGHGFATEQVHGGFLPDTAHGARVPAIHMTSGSSSTTSTRPGALRAAPTTVHLHASGQPDERRRRAPVALLERSAEAILVGSGQAAVTVVAPSAPAGRDHVVSARSIYDGTKGLPAAEPRPTRHRGRLRRDQRDLDAGPLRPPNTKAFFAETIPNPKNDVLDIQGVADTAHRAGVPLVVDTPWHAVPGPPSSTAADVVVHSASKFLSGHGAGLGGSCRRRPLRLGPHPRALPPHLTTPERALGGRATSSGTAASRSSCSPATSSPHASPVAVSAVHAFLLRQGIETLSLAWSATSRTRWPCVPSWSASRR